MGNTPAPEAPVLMPAAFVPVVETMGVTTFGFRRNRRPKAPVNGMMATRANQGVADTLTINRSGNNALVMAQAVANLEHTYISPTP